MPETERSVSVVIPCYNAAPFLRETILSALHQTHTPLEVIVVDDGSSDGSSAIAESFGAPVKVIRQPNRGESVARNRGMDIAQGHWTALLDADDVWLPDKLQGLLEAYESAAEPKPICVYSDFFLFGATTDPHMQRPEYHAAKDHHIRMLLDWSIPTITAMFVTEIGREVRFPEEIQHGEEWIFFLMLREKGTFVRVPKPLAGYRRHGRTQSGGPDHLWLNVSSRLNWFLRHESHYDTASRSVVRTRFAQELVRAHDMAWRENKFRRVQEVRDLYIKSRLEQPEPSPFRRSILRRRFALHMEKTRMLLGALRRRLFPGFLR